MQDPSPKDTEEANKDKFQAVLLIPTIIFYGLLAVLLQLRLSSLGLSPISFELPDLPVAPSDYLDLAGIKIEKLGEGDLLYPEAIAVSKDKESTAFLSLGDGRIVRLNTDTFEWQTVIYTGEEAKTSDGKSTLKDAKVVCGRGGPADDTNMEALCGRPLGLWLTNRASVDPEYQDEAKDEDVLLVADAYKGLLMVTNIYGGVADIKTLASRADTDPPDYNFTLLNGVVQLSNGDVYLTETSQKFQRRRIFHAAMDGAPTGRLLRYRKHLDGRTSVQVMTENNIYMANGMAISHDEKSILIVGGVKIWRYDLESNKGQLSPFVDVMPGTGDNIRAMNELPGGKKMKCYWAVLGGTFKQPFSLLKFLSDKPWLRSVVLALVPYRKIIDLIPKWTALAVYDEDGNLIETMRDDGNTLDENGKKIGVAAPWMSEMEPMDDNILLLSWYNPFLGRIKRSSIKERS